MKVAFIIIETNMYPRLGIMALSATLKAAGHDVRLLNAGRLSERKLHAKVAEYAPDVIAYSIMTGEHVRVLEVNRNLKRHFRFISVFGGAHATFSPEMIEDDDACDAVCRGEGDIAFPEFCRRLDAGEAYWESPNFVVRHEGRIHRNALLPLVADLDTLPPPDYDLMYQAEPELAREVAKSFIGTRGCPYECTYCFNVRFNDLYRGRGPILRHRSPERLVDEVCYVKKSYPLKYVVFQDDTFVLKPKGWIERFCEDYKARAGLPFMCTVRANVADEEDIRLLVDAGLRCVWTGIECGDEDVAKRILGRSIGNDKILQVTQILHKYGVSVVATNLLGLPVRNSYETDLKTLDFNIAIKPIWGLAGLVYPYPKTPIRMQAEADGFLTNGEAPILDTARRYTAFTFPNPREKRHVENLCKLFDSIVQHPWLRPYCNVLCDLPLGPVYTMLNYARFGYTYKWKLFPFDSFWREFWMWLRFFLRRMRRT